MTVEAFLRWYMNNHGSISKGSIRSSSLNISKHQEAIFKMSGTLQFSDNLPHHMEIYNQSEL